MKHHPDLVAALRTIITHNVALPPEKEVILIYDEDSSLSRKLAEGYKEAIANYPHRIIKFDPSMGQELKEQMLQVEPGIAIILVQTTSFRISEYRIRLDLNKQKAYVIEHSHLDLIKPEEEETYLACLTYDHERYKKICDYITPLLQNAAKVEIISHDGSVMTYQGPFEKIYYNIGEIQNTLGSFYPIGEFFTEPLDLKNVNGTFQIYAYPSDHHETIIEEPFHINVEGGSIISHDGPERFEVIMDLIRSENNDGRVPIREMGFGLNRFIGKHAPLGYVGSHERQLGFHVSLGLKHGIYRKKMPNAVNQRFHIDLFINVGKILVDDVAVFENGEYKSG
ncbi:hypothetical protein HYV86_01680 [Candidatus Woesearchaeota archaeon]|nr:hypothetical protein [Candidatus Woesearchaeota archaeon]